MGICALCRCEAELENSHLIPQWAYKRILELEGGDKQPVLVTSGTAALSNKQTTRRLLCKDCEQLFSIREDYVSRITRLEDGQPSILKQVTRLQGPDGMAARLSDEVDAEQLLFFAASIIWRACVMGIGCNLGPYEPKFREYLLGKAAFPGDVVLTMAVLESSDHVKKPSSYLTLPSSIKARLIWLHGFMAAGLAFRCFIGKTLNPSWRVMSLAEPGQPRYVSLMKPEEFADFRAALSIAAKATPRGKLARL